MNNNEIDWDDDSVEDFPDVGSPQSTVAPPPVIGGDESVVSRDLAEVEALNDSNSGGNIVAVEASDMAGDGEHMNVVQVDEFGNRVSTTVNLSLPPLDEDEAREITERIKGTTNLLYLLIKRAHAGKAYKALGYSSFEAYVREEFNYSRSYAYKLLNQANVIEAIEAVVPEGTEVYVGELTARGLKSSLPELIEDIEERTAGASPEDAARLLEDAIRDVQEKKNEEKNFDEDFDDYGEDNDFSGGGSSPVDYIDDDDESLDDYLNEDEPVVVVQRLEWIWKLLNGLKIYKELSETDTSELLPFIPESHYEGLSESIETNLEFLEKFKNEWEAYRESLPDSNNGEDENSDSDSDTDLDEIDF